MVQVEISGFSNGTCSDCGELDGTWILESNQGGHPAFGCTYGYTFDSAVCGVVPGMEALFQNVIFSSDYEFRLRLWKVPGFGTIQYAKVFGATMPSCQITGEVLTNYSNTSLGECDGSLATITATSLNM
jgi:hypothetical protein